VLYLGDFVTNGSGGLSGPNFMAFRPPVTPAPELGVARSGDNATITWAAKNIPGVLQRAANLSAPNWTAVTNPTSVTGPTNVVTVPLTASDGFFRLRILE